MPSIVVINTRACQPARQRFSRTTCCSVVLPQALFLRPDPPETSSLHLQPVLGTVPIASAWRATILLHLWQAVIFVAPLLESDDVGILGAASRQPTSTPFSARDCAPWADRCVTFEHAVMNYILYVNTSNGNHDGKEKHKSLNKQNEINKTPRKRVCGVLR